MLPCLLFCPCMLKARATIRFSTPSIHASIQPDMECGFGWTPWTSPVGSQTPGSPPFQFSHYTRVRNPDTLRFTSASFEGNNEQSLESPVMKGSLPQTSPATNTQKKEPSSFMWDHNLDKHPQEQMDHRDFKFTILSSHKDPLSC